MKRYHLRRRDKMIRTKKEILGIVRAQKYLTLALCLDREPYLVSLNYGFDITHNCFFFHCGKIGKKMDFLKANPLVWGQIIDDRGYRPGDCDHDYRTVQFRGRVSFLKSEAAMRRAMSLMAGQLEPDPGSVRRSLKDGSAFKNAAIGRIQVQYFTGKKYLKGR
jgi:nitroimidazol reductase NimA-like FMN-containing flavoprotein (pyridoxamine 5'-phosphate oxidase superfamily)